MERWYFHRYRLNARCGCNGFSGFARHSLPVLAALAARGFLARAGNRGRLARHHQLLAVKDALVYSVLYLLLVLDSAFSTGDFWH
jgi:hypothetical protein